MSCSDGSPPAFWVCPFCHGFLVTDEAGNELCSECDRLYPQRGGVVVFLTEEQWRQAAVHLEQDREALLRYSHARRHVPLTRMYYDRWVGEMFSEIPANREGPLVELMCGGAEICRRLPERFSAALALDVNHEMLECAARDLKDAGETRVRLACGTATRLPLPDRCSEVVLIQGALHHARPVLDQILTEVWRILKPSGVLVGSEPANDHPLIRAVRHWQYRRSRLQGNDPDEDGFTRAELAAALSTCGLRLDRYRRFGFIGYPLMGNTDLLPLLARSRSRWTGMVLLQLDRVLERIPLLRSLAWASLFRAVKPAP